MDEIPNPPALWLTGGRAQTESTLQWRRTGNLLLDVKPLQVNLSWNQPDIDYPLQVDSTWMDFTRTATLIGPFLPALRDLQVHVSTLSAFANMSS